MQIALAVAAQCPGRLLARYAMRFRLVYSAQFPRLSAPNPGPTAQATRAVVGARKRRRDFVHVPLVTLLVMLGYALPAFADEGAKTSRGWGMGTLGLQATEWRVSTRGIERGLMATYGVAGVTAGSWWTLSGSQFLSLGGGEGGFQAEYLTRAALGVRFLRSSHSAFVLRGGATLDAISTPHGGTLQLGPLVDFGYQILSDDGLLDIGVQTVVPVFPALFWHDSSHHPGEWFNTGPRVTAAFRSVFAQGAISRTDHDRELRTEFHLDLCGSSVLLFCTRLHNYRYDDDRKPVTLIALVIGFGGIGPSRQGRVEASTTRTH